MSAFIKIAVRLFPPREIVPHFKAFHTQMDAFPKWAGGKISKLPHIVTKSPRFGIRSWDTQ